MSRIAVIGLVVAGVLALASSPAQAARPLALP